MDGYLFYHIMISVCIVFSAFFSATETALLSSRRLAIETLAHRGRKGAARSLYILDHAQTAISMVLIGNNIVNVSSAAFITYVLTTAYNLNDTYLIIATIIQTIFFLLVCEIMPKLFSKSKAESFLINFSLMIVFFMKVLGPPARMFLSFAEFLKHRFNIKSSGSRFLNSREDIATFFSIGHKDGIIDSDNRSYISELLSFRDSQAYEIMIPFVDVVSIDVDSSIKDLVTLIEKTKFSKIPVYEESSNNIIGYVYYRDLLKGGVSKIRDILIDPVFIPETRNIFDIYNDMSRRNIPLVFVVNEYGDTTGFITFEDIAEEIVGDIDTSDHPGEDTIVMITDRKYQLSGRLDIDYFIRYFGIDIRKRHFETLAGFLMSIDGIIPEKGDRIHYEGCEFIVEEMSNRTIERVTMILPPAKKKKISV